MQGISQWLDGQRPLVSLVASDLRRQGVRETGRRGVPAETVLRCALLKQQRQLSYEELAFHLEDLASFRAFARLPLRWSPKKSVLHHTISALRPQTWEAVNQALLVSAQQEKLESGGTVRIDSTVSAALMHQPSDSTLLWDAVPDHDAAAAPGRRMAGSAGDAVARSPALAKRARAIDYSRGKAKKRVLYRELIAAVRATRAELQTVAEGLPETVGMAAERRRARAAQPLFRLTRSSPTSCLCLGLTQSNRRGTDPYARWWGRGGIARCPPIPILGASSSLPHAFAKVHLLNPQLALRSALAARTDPHAPPYSRPRAGGALR